MRKLMETTDKLWEEYPASEAPEGLPSAIEVAQDLLIRYNANENNVQDVWNTSPEPYRSIMYTLLPYGEKIDGTAYYWEIVRRFEGLLNNREPEYDWHD